MTFSERRFVRARTKLWIGIAILALVTVCIFSWVLWTTNSYQKCLAQKEQPHTAEATKKDFGRIFFSERIFFARNDAICAWSTIHRYRDSLTATATIFIALFTATLWRSTKNLWRESRRASGIAARAARASMKAARAAENQTKAFIAIESPVVGLVQAHGIKLVEITGQRRDPVPPGPIPNGALVVITASNVGRTAATVTGFSIHWDILKELPPNFTYRLVLRGIMLPKDGVQAFTIYSDPVIITDEQRGMLSRREACLWVHGYLVYQNLLKESVEVPFRQYWDESRGFMT